MTPTTCPECHLPIGSDDPFDDCCACLLEATECWNCGSLDHDEDNCPFADDDPTTIAAQRLDLPPAIRRTKRPAERPRPTDWVCSECGLVPSEHHRFPCPGGLLSDSAVIAAEHVRVAVYGTLRHGEGNHAWSLKGLPWAVGNIDGSLFYVRGDRGAYPVCVLGTGERTVVEVYDVPIDVYDEVARMELGAGYDAVTVDVANAAGPATWRAVVFGWSPDRPHGAPVAANDWLRR